MLIPPILFKFSHSILDWTALSWNFLGDLKKYFLEGSADHIIYRDYTVYRRSFIYCSLACVGTRVGLGGTGRNAWRENACKKDRQGHGARGPEACLALLWAQQLPRSDSLYQR